MTPIKRLVSLDVIRALAVFLVFGAHIYPAPPNLGWVHGFTEIWKRGGFVGVDMFFVLSGFLVSGLLFREYQKQESVQIRRFLVRRALKLYPSLWVVAMAGAYLYAPVPLRKLIGELFFLQNYVGSIWLHTWSIAVEEHFYLLLAALVAYWVHRTPAGQNPFRRIPALFIAIAVGSFALRLYLGLFVTYDAYSHGFPTHTRLDELMLGVFISYFWYFGDLQQQQWWRRGRYALLGIAVVCIAPAFLLDQSDYPQWQWAYIVGNNLYYWGSGALLLSTLAFGLEGNGLWRAIGKIGSYSYSIYLWHLPVEIITRTILEPYGFLEGNGWYIYFTVYVVGAVLWGIAMFTLIEFPFVRLRDKWFPSRVPLVAANS